MKNPYVRVVLAIVAIIILLIIVAVVDHASHKSQPVETAPSLSMGDTIMFYTNSYHGYGLAYPGNVQLRLVGTGGGINGTNGYIPEDLISTTTAWYASTCVVLSDASSTWFIRIASDSNLSGAACTATGRSSDGHPEQDTLTVNGKRVNVVGDVEPDYASSVYDFPLSNTITVEYGVSNGNSKNYYTILSSVNSLLSSLTLLPHFVPSLPPPNGRG